MNKKYYKVEYKGFDTCEWGSKTEEAIIEAENEEEALKIANQWCEDHTFMGGYEWYVEGKLTEMVFIPKYFFKELITESRRWEVAHNRANNSTLNVAQNIKDYVKDIEEHF